ncbi:5'-3' exonuclease [Planctomonas sp. JC2975]|uniref:5'-3' exonuclease n=1 Tax=Planctomonas sp. JC2975 TaxID=2729626 RepID=UPI0014746DF0|nr:5'-3' exonuclease [Planctomonas sp. JC2975]NNC12474.1 5'-3' exonuclease [Planctomonas sp. JC2975]
MLLDTASLYFRAFYGVPDSVKDADGMPVNGIRGLLDIIAKLVTDYEPTALVACWDDDWRPRWRVDLIPQYKAHRVAELNPGGVDVEDTPAGLVPQVPVIRRLLGELGIPVVGAEQAEADDIIGFLTRRASDRPSGSMAVDVVTGDRDLFQLVDDAAGVRIIYTARGMSKLELVTDAVVEAKYGISPRQYAAFAALRGDPSDGLPGVAGVGEKTAAGLLREFGDLDGILAAAADPSVALSPSVRMKLTASTEYLARAMPAIVVGERVDLPEVDGTLHPLDAERLTSVHALGQRYNLGGSLDRALKALTAAA